MLIECRARRKRLDIRLGRKDNDLGTKIKLPQAGNQLWWFRPQPELLKKNLGDDSEYVDLEAHVCEVDHPVAIARFLELVEEFNEYGKPPKIKPEPGPAPGQPEVVIELVDADDTLGQPDNVPVDPLAAAKELQQEWITKMLNQPVNVFVKDLKNLDDDELEMLLMSERAGKRRKGQTEALKKALAPTITIPPAAAGGSAEIPME